MKAPDRLLERVELRKLVDYDEVDELEFCGDCGKDLVADDKLCEQCIQERDEVKYERRHPDDPAG